MSGELTTMIAAATRVEADIRAGRLTARQKNMARLPETSPRKAKPPRPACRLCGDPQCFKRGDEHCKICSESECLGHYNLGPIRGFISPASRFYGGTPRPRDRARVVADTLRAAIEQREANAREAAQRHA